MGDSKWQSKEITLWIDNEEPWYKRKWNMFAALWQKQKKGIYDRAKAEKLFSYLVDEVARDWNKKYAEGEDRITREGRIEAAKELVKDYEDTAKNEPTDLDAAEKKYYSRVVDASRYSHGKLVKPASKKTTTVGIKRAG